MQKLFRRSVILLLILVLVAGVMPLSASAASKVISVSEQDISRYGFLSAVQSALNQARDSASASTPYTVTVPAGSYGLSYVLRMYSYTTLDLRGVTLRRTNDGNMLRAGDEDGESTGATGYDYYKNITVLGGVFDGDYGENTIIKAFHTTNFTMDGCTLKNESEGHMTEFAGVDGLTVRGCTFQNQLLTKGHYGYEAIQLDVLHPFHITNGRCEDLACKNVLVENCTFDNVPRGVGSHTAVLNNPHDKITIRGNRFTNIGSIAIQGMNWTNVDIRSNYIKDAPRGITIYSAAAGNTYLPSLLASKGGTTAHYSDSYKAPAKSNINIAYNELVNIGAKDDIYASYESQAIALLGENLTAKVPKDSSDESGGTPAGDYYINGASIHDNYIDIRGNGIRVEDARGISIESNEILCTKNTVQKNRNFYGIVFRDNVQATSISFNAIVNAEVNAMQLVDSSVSAINYNYVNGTGKYGIVGYNTSMGDVTDNDVIGAATQGIILIEASKASKVKWNRVRNCGSQGLYFTADSAASEVSRNTTVNCGGDIQYSKSAGLVTVDTNYTASAALTSYHIPRYAYRESKGARMGVGTSFKITPDVRPTNGFGTFSYSSSDSAVVSVDKYGRVSAKKAGYAVITVKSGNGITKTYPVLVEGSGDVEYLSTAPEKPKPTEPPTEPPTEAPTEPPVLLGDVDDDGVITEMDASFIQRFCIDLQGDADGLIALRGDIAGDGVDISDATFIQRKLAGIEVPYPVGEPMT